MRGLVCTDLCGSCRGVKPRSSAVVKGKARKDVNEEVVWTSSVYFGMAAKVCLRRVVSIRPNRTCWKTTACGFACGLGSNAVDTRNVERGWIGASFGQEDASILGISCKLEET